ncbi:MAG TPA: hypothetical protein VG992_03905 [Candidatus Saccharimonadales bacterium]|nr:hypothetical protein [Candidatus Saccharimonadales bacterium]
MSDPATLPTTTGAAPPPQAELDHWQELQRLATFGRLSASLLHEISHPLTAASLHLEQDGQPRAIRNARRNLQLLQRYIEAARQQLRQASQATNFSLQPQLNQVKRVVLPLAKRRGVKLEIIVDPAYRLWGDPVKFQQLSLI